MQTILPIICFLLAALSFASGFITEYYINRDYRGYDFQPTLPFAVPAAIFIVFGLITLNLDIPLWQYVVIFFVSVFFFGFFIAKASVGRSDR